MNYEEILHVTDSFSSRKNSDRKLVQVPKSFLLQIIGEDRVTKFVIQEIVSSTLAEYVKKASPLAS